MLGTDLLGAVLLVGGLVASYLLWKERTDTPAQGWHVDPTTDAPRQRLWDGQAWTSATTAGEQTGGRGHRFRGRFWGWWVLLIPAAFAIQNVGSSIYSSTEQVWYLAITSLLSSVVVALTFYIFVSRQLNFGAVVTWPQIASAAVAGAGGTLLVALNVNTWIEELFGLQVALATVGIVEEGTKLIVPLALYAFVRYRNPRAGLAIALASGAGFAIAEGTLYAFQVVENVAPNPCSATAPATVPTISGSINEQMQRIFTVEPSHFLWTGIAVAIVWRLWHIYGRARLTPAVIGAILIPVVLHSGNDSSSYLACSPGAGASFRTFLMVFLPILAYLLLKFFASQSTPPDRTQLVSKGWRPAHLRTTPVETEGSAQEPEPAGINAEDPPTDGTA